MSQSSVQRWVTRFQKDGNAVEDRPKSGAPNKRQSKLEAVRQAVQRDRCSSIREIARQVHLSYGSTQKVIKTDLKLKKKSARWIPHLLNQAGKDRRVQWCREALAMMRRRVDPVHFVVAADESWIFAYDPESKEASRQWMEADQPHPPKVRHDRFCVKVMLVAFLDRQGVIHHEYVPNGRGITRHVYRDVLIRLREHFRRRRPHLWHDPDCWALLHDGAPAHTSGLVVNFLCYHDIQVIPHPGSSPDLNPLDYWFFSRVKRELKGRHFRNTQELEQAADQVIHSIFAEFAHQMDRYPERLRSCIASRDEYFDEHRI